MDAMLTATLQRLGLKPSSDSVSAAYLVGSRLWGTEKFCNCSDYDLVIIVPGSRERSAVSQAGEKRRDIVILGEVEFLERLQQHEMLSLVCRCLTKDHPNTLLLSNNFKIPNCPIDKAILLDSMNYRLKEDWFKSNKFFAKGKFFEGTKIMCHSLRGLMFAIQYATHGYIVDFQEEREFFNTMLWIRPASSFDECVDIMQPLRDRLLHQLESLVEKI